MNQTYQGTIIAESLSDQKVIQKLDVISQSVSLNNRWHLYSVRVTKEQIRQLAKFLKQGTWYMHFWQDKQVIAAFRDQIFEFDYDDIEAWKPAIDYGLSLGIPLEQLDFPIDGS